MLDPTARTLRLLSLLQTHQFWPGDDLAGELGVSGRTLRRDIDRLRELGYPVDATPGVAGGYRLAAGAHMPPLLLDDDEAVAIAVGLRTAATSAVAGIDEISLRAMAKLEQVLPDRLRRRVSSLQTSVSILRWGTAQDQVDPSTLATLAQACRDREEVRFAYERKDGEASDRLVQPEQLVSVGRRWYLMAWDVRRDDWRTFRLDRLADPRLAGVRFGPRPLPAKTAADYVMGSIRSVPMAFAATVTVEASRDEVIDVARWLDSDLQEVAENRCQVAMKADTVGWLVSNISMLAIRFPVRVDAADEVLDLLATTGERMQNAR